MVIEGSEQVPADAVVMAFGFQPNPQPWMAEHGVELDGRDRIKAPERPSTPSRPATPRCSPVVTRCAARILVVTAIYEGRKAAEGIIMGLPGRVICRRNHVQIARSPWQCCSDKHILTNYS